MNRFQPEGRHTVSPRIITPTLREMVDFVKQVFDDQGDFHRRSEIRVGDSLIMISDGDGLRPAMPAFLYVYVVDVDEIYRRAVEAGAELLEVPSDQPYGDRRANGERRMGQPVANCFASANVVVMSLTLTRRLIKSLERP